MEDPGENLKRERELRGITLQKMHEATKVQMKHLEALEADDYAKLPHPTFVRGFIKSYCKVLGLDETDALLRYEMYSRENAPASGGREAAPASGGVSRQNPFHRLRVDLPGKSARNIAVLVAAGLVIMVLFYLFSARHEKGSAPPADNEIAAVNPEGQKTAEPQEKPPGEAATDAATDNADANGKKPVQEALDPALNTGGRKHTLVVKASERTWIRVRVDDGEPFDVMLRKGESIVWKAGRNISVLVGNAGGVDMVFDG
ncbi:MAG: RodZ domain-containing protein, partial [Deltaproteobacteria bacterium]